MQIDFASSGGAASRPLVYRAETGTLPEEQARELERLVESSGALDMRQEDASSDPDIGRGDVISYRLSLSDGVRQVDLWYNDVTAPASLRPLLRRLRELAHEQE